MNGNFETFKIIAETVVTLAFAIIGVVISVFVFEHQKKDSKISKTMICLTDLFTYYKKTMKKLSAALQESKKLKKYLCECMNTNFSNFNEVYYSDEYKNLREVHYFFELLGTLIRLEEIDKESVWHYFSFPIEYFMETKDLRNLIIMNNCLPSYAENFSYLFVFYNNQKKKINMPWIKNGETFFLSEGEVKEYTCGYEFPKEKKKKI